MKALVMKLLFYYFRYLHVLQCLLLHTVHIVNVRSLTFIDIDDCIGNTCVVANTNICVDGLNVFTCQCILGYNETNCENSKYKSYAKYCRM